MDNDNLGFSYKSVYKDDKLTIKNVLVFITLKLKKKIKIKTTL